MTAGPGAPGAFGTDSFTAVTVNSFAFVPFDSTTVYTGDGSNGRYVTAGNACFEAALSIPSGAILDHAELEGCDGSATGSVSTVLFMCHLGTCSTTASVSTGNADTPGCALFPSTPAPVVIDNAALTYTPQMCVESGSNLTRFKGVRYFYQLQVSPAPATASFGDVPTDHPFFRYVEALTASGITAGCGSGNYCPDNPLTRGQMAVFLAKALGLHFPN